MGEWKELTRTFALLRGEVTGRLPTEAQTSKMQKTYVKRSEDFSMFHTDTQINVHIAVYSP